MLIDAEKMTFQELNGKIHSTTGDILIKNCCGQRFIAAGECGRIIEIDGTPGNALGAYLNGATVNVYGNAQDATGDTMNDGKIVIHGNCGDAAGYAMRGGEIYIKGNVGYRTGIHMKEYMDKIPVMVIGGRCGSFLGEYQAGGKIIVLGLGVPEDEIVGYFCGTGMHGGRVMIRAEKLTARFPEQVCVARAGDGDMESIKPYLKNFSEIFDVPIDEILSKPFYVLSPNTSNPYKQLYVQN